MSRQDQSMKSRRGTQGVPELWHFEKNGPRHFSLIGHHLESVGRTEPVFELNLALSEKRPTNECRSDLAIFLIDLSC